MVRAGQDIICWCTRCKMDLAHVVIAEVSGHPVRVSCKTCDSVHKYRPKGQCRVSLSSKPRDSQKVLDDSGIPSSAWQEAISALNRGEKKLKSYDMAAEFEVGDLLAHPLFGKGVVIKLLSNKIEVLFERIPKILAHKRGHQSQ